MTYRIAFLACALLAAACGAPNAERIASSDNGISFKAVGREEMEDAMIRATEHCARQDKFATQVQKQHAFDLVDFRCVDTDDASIAGTTGDVTISINNTTTTGETSLTAPAATPADTQAEATAETPAEAETAEG